MGELFVTDDSIGHIDISDYWSFRCYIHVTVLRDARYALMHTFAHLLIKKTSMSARYLPSAY